MKKFFAALFVMILFAATASAQPVRIARLPIIFQSTIPDEETRADLETKITRAIHIPLNGTLQLAEYLPPDESARALDGLWQNISAQNKKANLSDAMRPLAQNLDADLIVCPVLKKYSQYVTMGFGWNSETYIVSQAAAELIVYDRRSDELTVKKNSQIYNDVYSLRGTASALSKICFDKIIDSSGLRQIIRDIR
ncbi:MAG: hypothetical protein IJG80_10475 [Selenomonadaceae bacterium]|nr:hypothetical protein [Selenomonadaceae bacterium]MBQ3727496.1 hypothetical protein [Selenomonadaceae bacterium]MBQ9497717.1 hypothetical protein [Selenomonadaceae bacterium]